VAGGPSMDGVELPARPPANGAVQAVDGGSPNGASAWGSGLGWHHVSWHAEAASGPERRVLHNLSGYAARGQVTAMLGPSGSGKTTLLDILAWRKTVGKTEGTVLFEGCERRSGSFQCESSYVPHEDGFLPTLTVLETMQYHAAMRPPRRLSSASKPSSGATSEDIDEVLGLVGLLGARRTMVGGVLPGGLNLRGLSGGERKRLNLAAAMLSDPSLVFADEPTSGLDTMASLKVLQVLKEVASHGKVVLLTVHQPRGSIWRLFDQLYLLSEGWLMYTGSTSEASAWFESLGFEAPAGVSPADWLLDLVTVGFDKGLVSWRCCGDAEGVAAASQKFLVSEQMKRVLQEATYRSGRLRSKVDVDGTAPRQMPWTVQFRTLLWRHALNYARNLGNVVARLFLSVASGLVVGACYTGLRTAYAEDARGIPDRLGALFFVCVVLMITPNCTMALFSADRRFYAAESAAHLYGSLSYYIPLAMCELLLNFVAAGLFWIPVSLLSGMRQDIEGMACGLLLCGLVQLCGAQITNFSALLFPNQELAFVGSVALNVLSFITSGFLVRTQDLLFCVRWLRYTSPVKLGFQALALSELSQHSYDSGMQLEALRVALQNATGRDSSAGGAWWLRQPPLRHMVTHVLDEVLPCVDPCISGMVVNGREALSCLGLEEPDTILAAVLGLIGQLLTLHLAGWLCLRHLHGERR